MPVLISGVLKDATGTPVQNCTIQLKACRTSTTVVVNTVASENPDDAGRYSMDVEQGQYTVTLLVEGYPPSHAGVITVYDDSKPGTLNDFLGAMTEDDVRPEALRRFEAMVEEVARQASEASRNATAAGQASEQAQTSAGQASESATAAVNAAGAAEASATQAASSAASAESSAGTATTKAGEASASAASADTARTAAAASAAASAAAAKTSEANADASRTAAGDSAAAAAASATAAQTSAERAGASETAAKTSETQAASSAGGAGASATAAAASEKAAAASAAAAKTSETNAATSASTAAASATAASSSASEASTHAAASDTSASLAAQSSTAAGAAATRAEDAAKRAEDIADVISLEDASLTKKGIVKLSSATDSDSEALAATPKAVHAVMDEVQTKAPLDSPVFTGTPTTPTPPDDAKGLQTANAEFVRKLIAALVGSVPESLDTLQELADALGNDPNFATTVLNKLAGKQPLDDTLTALSGKSIEGLIEYVGLRETINHAADALQKSQNGGDIPDKKQFARTISAVTSTTITLGESGWFKIATVFMPQATSTAVIKLYGGSGYNVGSFEQAAISELVLRAGNGSPVGITATLWMRSPSSANEVAWVNTSGDTYDIYINIGQYAYWLIAQYDYTGNANVTLYSAPEYSETKPANATNGQTYTLYNSMMKPTAGDVEALSVNGGRLNGALGIGTDNVLGGSSIVFGDNDTGFKQNGDGILDTFANSQHTVRVAPGEMQVLGAIRAGNAKRMTMTSSNNSVLNAQFNLWGDGNRPTVIELDDDQGWHLYSQRNTDGSIQFVVNGQVIPDNYGNFDARYLTSGNVYTKGESDNRYVQNIQRGAPVWPGKVDEYGPAEAPAGCFLTQARHDPTTAYGVTFAYRPLQMWVGNGWRTING
ncbi:TPA: prophage tail fiber N-terminal domain-containing protein [Salmonella enterica subsp. enterica serovar Wangata]|uniref:prophage tail fiber N-terminal domain-containing protein n=1 Tax=Salmonella sp. SG193 TaxID=2555402 RepID=UPI001288BEFF|nr:prophage tail fiber N-terminal domain-containing protein [Salmonella sp. SG193]EBW1790170.1 shikimate transporter [Salmonella enterica subsp. enterica serovar Wangata]EBW5580909.1 shikimate transporter [Salmonella enterica subsp. enterica serovar Teddington]EHS6172794.1 prophage tail fiber N-terminal domain-containing protein [Salmonella enterica]EBY8300886.1 shikimate transporter [Salmonella enterica subsp. enterica serovar Wangata]ECA5270111.1 shikimate transporter [Salmonella enterica su